MYKIKTGIEIAGAHQLDLSYDSPCQRLHGHNWQINITLATKELDEDGMVVDFKGVKALLKTYIHDVMDHKNLNDVFDFNPTAENIAHWVSVQMNAKLAYHQLNCKCVAVEVHETPNNIAIWEEDQ